MAKHLKKDQYKITKRLTHKPTLLLHIQLIVHYSSGFFASLNVS